MRHQDADHANARRTRAAARRIGRALSAAIEAAARGDASAARAWAGRVHALIDRSDLRWDYSMSVYAAVCGDEASEIAADPTQAAARMDGGAAGAAARRAEAAWRGAGAAIDRGDIQAARAAARRAGAAAAAARIAAGPGDPDAELAEIWHESAMDLVK